MLEQGRVLGYVRRKIFSLQLAVGLRTALVLTSGMASSRNFLTQHKAMLDSKSHLTLCALIAPALWECLGA